MTATQIMAMDVMKTVYLKILALSILPAQVHHQVPVVASHPAPPSSSLTGLHDRFRFGKGTPLPHPTALQVGAFREVLKITLLLNTSDIVKYI